MEKSFEKEFHARLLAVKNKARELGTSLTAVCQEAGVARATPDRCAIRAPKSVQLIDKLEAALDRILKGQAAK